MSACALVHEYKKGMKRQMVMKELVNYIILIERERAESFSISSLLIEFDQITLGKKD